MRELYGFAEQSIARGTANYMVRETGFGIGTNETNKKKNHPSAARNDMYTVNMYITYKSECDVHGFRPQ